MKLKYLKPLSLIVAGILFTVLLVLSIFLAAVDPNEYKNEIENQFRASTGKTLRLNGPIELSILPRLVLEASDIEIVNEDNFHIPQFLRLSSIRISVNMFSLIRGDIEMDALTIDQLKVNLVKDERGIANWLMNQNAEEAKKEETSSKLLAVFLGGVNINNSEIKFHDEATKRRISVSDINIKISELSFEKPVELVGSIKFTDTGQELSGNAEVLGTITYGLKEKFYAFDDLKLDGKIRSKKIGLTEEDFSLFFKGKIEHEEQYLTIDKLQLSGLKTNLSASVGKLPLGRNQTKTLGAVKFNSEDLSQPIGILAPNLAIGLDKKKQQATLDIEFEADLQSGDFKITNVDALALGAAIEGNFEAENMFSSKPKINGSLKANTRDFLPLLKIHQHFDEKMSEEFFENLGRLKNRSLSFATTLKTLPKDDMIVLEELQLDLLGFKLGSNLLINQTSGRQNLGGTLTLNSENLNSILLLLNQTELSRKLGPANLLLKFEGDSEKLSLTSSGTIHGASSNIKVFEVIGEDISINIEDGNISVPELFLTGLGSKTKLSGLASTMYSSPTGTIQMNASDFNPKTWLDFFEIDFQSNDDGALQKLEAMISAEFSEKSIAVSQLDIRLDDTYLHGQIKIQRLPKIQTEFDLTVDEINFDKYLTTEEKAPLSPEVAAVGATTLPNDILRSLNGNGKIQIDRLKISSLTIENLIINGHANNGRIEIDPIEATLYEGNYAGVVSVDATKQDSAINIETKLDGIEIGPLLHDKTGSNYLKGSGSVGFHLKASGKSMDQLIRSARGNSVITLSKGVFTGIDTPALLSTAERILECKCIQSPPKGGATKFERLNASLAINNGSVVSNDFYVEGEGFVIKGSGRANLIKEQLQLNLALDVPRSRVQSGEQTYNLGGYSIPLRCNGDFQNPGCKPNLQPILKDIVKKKAKKKIEKVLSEKLKDTIGSDAEKALKKLFNF